jgi:ubiquinone/menaquinone biosynthesis C-methylase UbiE
MPYLDFGSGYNPKDGYLKCDFTYSPTLDFIFDNQKYKIINAENKYFDIIRCKNVIHHIQDIRKLFLEFQRVLKINGKLIIIEPSEKNYKTNLILDILWYRFIIPRYEIWFSNKYRDYASYLEELNFGKLLRTEIKEKEYYIFRRIY